MRDWKFPREKTAIHHPGNLSVAASRAVYHQMIVKKSSIVLDYGCGHGDDVRILREKGYRWVSGWDPGFLSAKAQVLQAMGTLNVGHLPRHPANVVLLSNVINVIEDPQERKDVLLHAFGLATECLVVTSYNESTGRKWGDGIVTSKGTFQKPYTRDGFRRFIRRVLGRKAGRIDFHSSANLAFVYTKEA